MDKTKIIERIKKLIALSTSSNEYEAALAISKAQELINKYALEYSDLFGIEQKNIQEITLVCGKRIPVWKVHLARLLGSVFDLLILRSSLTITREHSIVICGFEADLAIAEYAFNVLVRLIDKNAAKLRRQMTYIPPNFKNAFALGFLQGIKGALLELKRQRQSDVTVGISNLPVANLSEQKRKVLEEYSKLNNIGIEKKRGKTFSLDASTYEYGKTVGSKTSLYRPVAESHKATQAIGG